MPNRSSLEMYHCVLSNIMKQLWNQRNDNGVSGQSDLVYCWLGCTSAFPPDCLTNRIVRSKSPKLLQWMNKGLVESARLNLVYPIKAWPRQSKHPFPCTLKESFYIVLIDSLVINPSGYIFMNIFFKDFLLVSCNCCTLYSAVYNRKLQTGTSEKQGTCSQTHFTEVLYQG